MVELMVGRQDVLADWTFQLRALTEVQDQIELQCS